MGGARGECFTDLEAFVAQKHGRAQPRAVGDQFDPRAIHAGDQSKTERGVNIQLTAERAGQNDPAQVLRLDSEPLQRNIRRHADRGFGFLQLADVQLRQRNAVADLHSRDLVLAFVNRDRVMVVHEPPARVHRARALQRIHHAEQPRPGEANRRAVPDRRHAQMPIVRARVHHRAIHRADAARDVHPLKRRTRGGRSHQNIAAIRRHHLAVRAEVNRQHRRARAIKTEVREAGGGVRADEAADEGRERHSSPRRE